MNLKALIKAEDLHRDLMEIDARIAESHMILRDLSERDGQSLELHVKREQAKDPKGSDFNPDWLKSFMQRQGMSDMMIIDSKGDVITNKNINDLPDTSDKKSIFALDNQEAIIFIQMRLSRLNGQRALIVKSLEEAISASAGSNIR